jgi:hypothetical protein
MFSFGLFKIKMGVKVDTRTTWKILNETLLILLLELLNPVSQG